MVHDGYPRAKINMLKRYPSPAKKKADLASLMDEYPRVFDGICRAMSRQPCHFSLKEGASPVKMHGSRSVSEQLINHSEKNWPSKGPKASSGKFR
jgi:hypothetical protein